MLLAIIFPIVTSLGFTINYTYTTADKQDYFILQGPNNATAHLFRENKTLTLFLLQNTSLQIYNHSTSQDFNFKWIGYKINDEPMSLVKSVGSMKNLEFDYLTFISPTVLEVDDPADLASIVNCREINYGYIIFIVMGAVIGVEGKHLFPIMYKRFRNPPAAAAAAAAQPHHYSTV
jgi:hypothetical protein